MNPDGFQAVANVPPTMINKILGWLGCGTCCAPCNVTICLKDCLTGGPIKGGTITVQAMPPVSCTTGSNGCCSLSIGATGTYLVSAGAPGYLNFSQSMLLTCGQTYYIILKKVGNVAVQFTVIGCGSGVEGANCSIGNLTCTTDATGICMVNYLPQGTYTYTITKTRYQQYTGSVTIPPCSGGTVYISVRLVPAPGYAYAIVDGYCCVNDPVPTTLSLSDSITGGCGMTFSGDPVNGGVWTGSTSWMWTGYCSETPVMSQISYAWPVSGCEIGVTYISVPAGIGGPGPYPGTYGVDPNFVLSCSLIANYGCTYCVCCDGNFFPPAQTFSIQPTVPLEVDQTFYGCGAEIITQPWGPTGPTICGGQSWWGDPPQLLGCANYGAGATPVLSLTE